VALTVAQAVERLQDEYLDDPDEVRWSDAVCKRALQTAQDSILRELVMGGADFLRRTYSGNTGSTGELSLSSLAPLHVHAVYVDLGGRRFAIPRSNSNAHDFAGQALSVVVEYSGGVAWSDSDAHFILGDGAGAAVLQLPSLEEWVLARAALICLAKEPNARRQGASEVEGMMASVVKDTLKRRGGGTLRGRDNGVVQDIYQWAWQPVTNTLITGLSGRGSFA